jgi:hypothetical protein
MMFGDRHFHRSGRIHTGLASDTSPTILDIDVTEITDTTARVTWVLDEVAQGWIEYGQTTVYASETTHETSFSFSTHSQVLTGLSAGTTYHYRVRGVDQGGNPYVSDDATFDTTGSVGTFSGVYGVKVHATDLNNQHLGGAGSDQYSYRWRAEYSGSLTEVLIYIINLTPNYASGTGGTFRCQLQTDDGSSQHFPSGTVLASVQRSVPTFGSAASTKFIPFTFSSPGSVTAGNLYHFVWTNVHATPSTNYASLDNGWTQGTSSSANPRYPGYSNVDLAVLQKRGTGAWSETWHGVAHYPIMHIDIGANHQGVGYMEFWDNPTSLTSGQRKVLGGATQNDMARVRFTPSQTVTLTGGTVCVKRVTSGTGNLEVRLETSAGAEIETKTVDPSALAVLTPYPYASGHNIGDQQLSWTFASPRTVTSGQTYNLRFRMSSGATTKLSMLAMRDGSGLGFGANTTFSDGTAQETSDGTNWVNPVNLSNNRNLTADWKVWMTTSS